MVLTRQQSKKMNEANAASTARTTTKPSNTKAKPSHGVDFTDASKEWRRNKIKYDNCTFEYIWI